MEIIRKKTATAPKILIYGNAGVGKSTLAAQMPNPLFLDFEGGLNYMDVARTPVISSPDEFDRCLLELAKAETREFDTIVIDSADWMVRRLVEQTAGIGYDENHQKIKTNVELNKTLYNNMMDSNGGFGKAKEVLENHIRSKVLPKLAFLNQKGYGIVLIAHAYSTEILDDDGAAIEKILPKIDPPTIGKKPIAAPAIIEWVDNVFYLKKSNGERILQLEADNYALAKNRIGLTGEVSLAEKNIQDVLGMTKSEENNK